MADIVSMDEAGLRGASNYELWIGLGNDGTIEDFLAEQSAVAAAAATAAIEPILDQIYALSEIAKFTNSMSGSDSFAGTISSPYATIATADANTTAAQYIGLHKDGNYPTNSLVLGSNAGAGTPGKALVAYGSGVYNPRADARQNLSGLTWTLVGGSTVRWQTTVTFRGTTIAGSINGASTTNYRLWFNDIALTWQRSGADLAANQTLVENNPSSWTIQMVGRTAPDPRLDINGAANQTYIVTIHMPLGQNPNGQDVRIADQPAVLTTVAGLMDGIEIIGSNGKDSTGSTSDTGVGFTLLRNFKNTQFGAHGWVGPVHLQGTNYFTGRAVEGATGTAASNGRSLGGALNIFTAVDYTTRFLEFEGITYLSNATTGLYGHGSGNRGYAGINGEDAHLIIDNCNVGIKFDSSAGPASFFAGEVRIGRVTATNVDNCYVKNGDPYWKIGNTETRSSVISSTIATSTKTLANFDPLAAGTTIEIIDHDFKMDGPMESPSFTLNCLAVSTVPNTDTAPTLILRGCVDTQTIVGGGRPRNKAILQKTTSGGASWFRINLEIRDGSQLGSLSSMATPDFGPASIIVEAGCTWGWGDMTGPQIETLFTSLGITYSISHQSTIVNKAGAVVSAPGW